MRKLIIIVILCLSATSLAQTPKVFSFVGVETKTSWNDSWDSALRYGRITQSVELRYRFLGWLDGYTYLVGQTGWMQLKAPAMEIRRMNLYLYPNLLVGQGFEVKKVLLDFCELAVFAEIYSSLHTAVTEVKSIDSDLPKDSPGATPNAYDTNIGEMGFRAGIRVYKNFARWSLRFGAQYELDDLDIFPNPKVRAFKDEPSKVSEIDSTSHSFRFIVGANVKLPRKFYLTLDLTADLARQGDNLGISGYGMAAGLGYSF